MPGILIRASRLDHFFEDQPGCLIGCGTFQVHALEHTVGRSKCAVMKERILHINPECDVRLVQDFLTQETCEGILSRGYDFVVDAVDFAPHKAHIINFCFHNQVPIVCTGEPRAHPPSCSDVGTRDKPRTAASPARTRN